MDLSIKDIRMYSSCPFKYMLSRTTPYVTLLDHYNGKVEEMIYYYLYRKMTKHQKTLDGILKVWKSKIEGSPHNQHILEMSEKYLENFFTLYHKSVLDIISINTPFEIGISENIVVKDRFPLITMSAYGPEITIFNFDNPIYPESHYINDIIPLIYAKAFRTEFHKKENSIFIYNVPSNERILVSRHDMLYEKHLSILSDMVDRIPNEDFYPDYSSNCRSCVFTEKCAEHLRFGIDSLDLSKTTEDLKIDLNE